jgi:hypothetical protein
MLEAGVTTESIITCPACGRAKAEMMPTDACLYFYECTGCGTLLRPKRGDCCVFCSYGSVPCRYKLVPAMVTWLEDQIHDRRD